MYLNDVHQKNTDIEVLRAIAIIFTLFQHTAHTLLFQPNFLTDNFFTYFTYWGGVDLFFVISGFVITRSLRQSFRINFNTKTWRIVWAFWARRIYRIFPSAWLWLTLFTVFSYWFNSTGAFGIASVNLSDAIAAIFQYANWHAYLCNQGLSRCGPNLVYWSLSLEEQFYVLMPLVLIIFRKHLALALTVCLVPLFFLERYEWTLGWSFRFDVLIWGVLLALFAEHSKYQLWRPQFMKLRVFRIPVITLLLLNLAYIPLYSNRIPLFTSMAGLVSLALVFIASYDSNYILQKGWIQKIFLWIGSRSFSIYLIHIFTFRLAYEVISVFSPSDYKISTVDQPLAVVLAYSLLLILAEISYRYIELPFRNFGIRKAQQILQPV
ncbi:MAG: acyltransferase [Bacteriovorax sp.]|nr:acyltransferase [Bacteriovorax sp.]